MTVSERGAVRDLVAYTQPKNYTKLRYGKISPTDIDLFLDFGNKAFVFLELKHYAVRMPDGQRLGLERLCDGCGRSAILLLAIHANTSTEMVQVHELNVEKYRYKKAWHTPKEPITVKEAIDGFAAKFGYEGNVA